jgi:hypothetical protein
VHDDNMTLSAAGLLELNRDLQGSCAIRLLTTTNLGLYATLIQRHLSDGAVPETERVIKLERDLNDLDDAQSGLALIKSWASQGWLHRIVDERAGHDQNVCYLTQDARRARDGVQDGALGPQRPPGRVGGDQDDLRVHHAAPGDARVGAAGAGWGVAGTSLPDPAGAVR